MTKKYKMMAVMFCVAALATLSSCSKEEAELELLGAKWTCTYNKQFYGHFSENQYVGTVWNFSNEVADKDLHYYYLYINGIKVGSYSLNTYGEPNFYEIKESSIEHTVYTEIVEYLNGAGLKIKGNTLEHLDYAGNPIITWSKGSGNGSSTGGGSGSGTGTGGGNDSGTGSGSGSGTGSGSGNGSGTSGGGHGSGTGKSASNNGIGNWNSSYASATKAHSLMFSEGNDVEIR